MPNLSPNNTIIWSHLDYNYTWQLMEKTLKLYELAAKSINADSDKTGKGINSMAEKRDRAHSRQNGFCPFQIPIQCST